jgi:hypothetical protein
MQIMRILVIGLALTHFAQAEIIPQDLVDLHATNLKDQQCQPDWTDWVKETGFVQIDVSSYTSIYMLPCARWSNELSWIPYARFNEGNGLFRRLPLAGMDLEGQMVGAVEIYNPHWESVTQQLVSTYHYQNHLDCGLQHTYQWSKTQLHFQLHEIRFKPTCDGAMNPWPVVYSVPNS